MVFSPLSILFQLYIGGHEQDDGDRHCMIAHVFPNSHYHMITTTTVPQSVTMGISNTIY